MNKTKNGFTLVEIMIALAVGMIIMAAIYGMMNLGQKSSASVGRRVLTQQDARAVLDFMSMEIGMASFDQTANTAIWGNPNPKTSAGSTCASVVSFSSARRGIQRAWANEILVAMNLNADSQIGGSGDNEYVRYLYDSGNGTIRRAVSCGNYEDILGGTDSGTTVSNTNAQPLFRYFRLDGTELTSVPLSDADIALIRRIRITIFADVENPDEQGTFRVSRREYTTDLLVRNHALSN